MPDALTNYSLLAKLFRLVLHIEIIPKIALKEVKKMDWQRIKRQLIYWGLLAEVVTLAILIFLQIRDGFVPTVKTIAISSTSNIFLPLPMSRWFELVTVPSLVIPLVVIVYNDVLCIMTDHYRQTVAGITLRISLIVVLLFICGWVALDGFWLFILGVIILIWGYFISFLFAGLLFVLALWLLVYLCVRLIRWVSSPKPAKSA